MHEHVAEPGNGGPFDFGMTRLQRRGEALGGLGHGVEIAEHGVLRLSVGGECLVACRRVLFNASDALLDVIEIDAVVFHNGWASLSTCSRINGCKPSGSTISTRLPSRVSKSLTKPPGKNRE